MRSLLARFIILANLSVNSTMQLSNDNLKIDN